MMLSCRYAGQGNLLHLACEHNSPEYIIDKLVTICPQYVFELDNKHRLPLHVATENGTYRIVKSLLKRNKEAANTLDENGRSPLLTYFYTRAFADVKWIVEDDYWSLFIRMYQDIKVIDLMRSKAFFSILGTDNDGKSVLDYAKDGGVHKNVLVMLKEWEVSAMSNGSFESTSTSSESTIESFDTC